MTDPSPPPPREIYLSQTSDRDLFNRIASELARGLGGTWTAQINGLDQRYWDLAVEGQTITLHLEHYLGIMLLVEDADPDWIASERFQAVVRQLQTDLTKNGRHDRRPFYLKREGNTSWNHRCFQILISLAGTTSIRATEPVRCARSLLCSLMMSSALIVPLSIVE